MGGGGDDVHANAACVFCFFLLLPMCVAFRIGFYGVFADSRLFAHASLDLHLSFLSAPCGGGRGDGGG